jgi:hypothetical protein
MSAMPAGLPNGLRIEEEEMPGNPIEWELDLISPGSELMVTDAEKRPVARGILRDDRKGLAGPNGEYFSFGGWKDGWNLIVLKPRTSNPKSRPFTG